jgi:hypothetical protein
MIKTKKNPESVRSKSRHIAQREPALQETPQAGSQAHSAYIANRGEQFSFLLGEDFVEKHNVAWRVELATEETANPLIDPKFPWESAAVFSHGTILLDPIDGLWKAWYVSARETKLQSSAERRLCYAESKDGLNWTRPKLNICSYPGFPRTNILLDIESGGSSQHASVIVHPDAPLGSPFGQ